MDFSCDIYHLKSRDWKNDRPLSFDNVVLFFIELAKPNTECYILKKKKDKYR